MADDKSPAHAKNAAMKVDVELVRELAQLLTDTDLTEIEVEDNDRRIRVARQSSSVAATSMIAAPVAAAPLTATAAPATAAAANPIAEEHGDAVKSPMVGTVFLQPEPGAPPFKSVGDAVAEGETIIIIEAMKVMNAIAAPHGGKLVKMLVTSGQPVEFDQPLFVVA
ncbi:MAG: acetyl-CoA carboxylase biotin carboxyl carrier protein [Sphingopyxis sp.]